MQKNQELLQLRDAALQLGVSFRTIKQWIYKKKIRSVQTPEDITGSPRVNWTVCFFRTRGKTGAERTEAVRRVSGRNQLVGRIDQVRISGLMAEVKISIGEQQITSIITATSAREMHLKAGQTAVALIKATEVMYPSRGRGAFPSTVLGPYPANNLRNREKQRVGDEKKSPVFPRGLGMHAGHEGGEAGEQHEPRRTFREARSGALRRPTPQPGHAATGGAGCRCTAVTMGVSTKLIQ